MTPDAAGYAAAGTARPGRRGRATGTRDAASRLPGGRRRQWRRCRADRCPGAGRAGQHRAAGAAARARRLRTAADVTGAVVLLAGLPWGLSRLAGSPLPGHWPGWQQTRELAASPLTDGTAVTVLAGAAWLLWAVFAVAVIAEVTAAARGRPVPRLPAIAPVQALAATLAGTIVIAALHLPRTAARAAHPAHAALTATVTTAAPLVPGTSPRRRRPAGQRRGPPRDRPAGRGPRRRDIRASGAAGPRAHRRGRRQPVGPGPHLPGQRGPLARDLRPQPRQAAARRRHPHQSRPDLPRMGPADPRREPAPPALSREPARHRPPGPARAARPPSPHPARAAARTRRAAPPPRGRAHASTSPSLEYGCRPGR